MAYNHNSIVLAKRKFGLHLSYVIRHLTAKDITQRELAQLAKVSQPVISSIKNDRSERLSLPIMMKVADAIRLKYQITFNSVKGRCSVTVHVESALDYVANTSLKRTAKNIRFVTNTTTH
ncbi:helix-turn-helix domain-containing protein [Salmonella enterica]|nr:helix-turn-helix domain-containing protein [Salmonella enterica]